MKERWDQWHTQMRHRLEPGETELAAGRSLVTSGRRLPLGSTHDFVLVTDQRVLWNDRPASSGEEIAFDQVTAFSEGTFHTHRYVLALRHRPRPFLKHVSRWNIAWFHWGNAYVHRKRDETRFGFSRAGTEAALALRQQLASRDLPILPLTVPKPRAQAPMLVLLAALPIHCVAYWVLRLTDRVHAPRRHRALLSQRPRSHRTFRRMRQGPGPSAE